MAKLTKKEVLHVANLARLTLSEKEVAMYLVQLSKVVEFVSELGEVDTSGLEPTSQTTGRNNVFRVDDTHPENVLVVNEATSGTDQIYNGYFKVEAVLPKKGVKS